MSTATRPQAPTPHEDVIPPLRHGDRLTAAEFERRYDAMPHLKKAELIDGIVYLPSPDFPLTSDGDDSMGSPVSFRHHSAPHFDLIGWLAQYRAATPGVRGGDNGTIRLDLASMPQPDAFLIILPTHGGRVRIDANDYVQGAPELVAEVAFRSASFDLHAKFDAYRRNGASEYLVWRVEEGIIDWHILREGRYDPIRLSAEGLLRSEAFPGLWLDATALIRGELSAVFEAARRGLASPEHAAFVARLREAAAPEAPARPA